MCPTAANRFLRETGIVSEDDSPNALCLSAFGDLWVRTLAGHGIFVQPLARTCMIFEQPPDDRMFSQISMAGAVASAVDITSDWSRGPDRLVDQSSGGDLYKLTIAKPRTLKSGQVCGLPVDKDHEIWVRADFAVVEDLNACLLKVASHLSLVIHRTRMQEQ